MELDAPRRVSGRLSLGRTSFFGGGPEISVYWNYRLFLEVTLCTAHMVLKKIGPSTTSCTTKTCDQNCSIYRINVHVLLVIRSVSFRRTIYDLLIFSTASRPPLHHRPRQNKKIAPTNVQDDVYANVVSRSHPQCLAGLIRPDPIMHASTTLRPIMYATSTTRLRQL